MAEFDRIANVVGTASGKAPDNGRAWLSIASVWRAVVDSVDRFSEMCRRVRAFNELTRLDHRTLQEIGRRRGELDRVLRGLPPRPYRDGG